MNAQSRPKIVCLCGSTRFWQTFQRINHQETMAGNIVLAPGCDGHRHAITVEQKKALDELHFRKIDLADEVYVININRYIGESTKNEIVYAIKHGKPIRYLETT